MRPVRPVPGVMTVTTHSVPMARATPSDAEDIVDLRDAAARWQPARGITQWRVGELAPESVAAEAAKGEWWVLRRTSGSGLLATVRIIDTDPMIWGDATDGGYIHGLLIARDATGERLGSRVLAWAEAEISGRGHRWARLDCVASNSALRAYYTHHGYLERGVIDYGPDSAWQPSALFEKSLGR